MLLAADIGNTKIGVGFLDGLELRGTWRMTTDGGRSSDEYALTLRRFMGRSGVRPEDVDGVIVCSVVPAVMHSFRAAIVKLLGVEPMVVGPGVRTGIRVTLDNPRQTGADRIADVAAAWHLYGGPTLVVDFGTATTYDFLDGDGAFRAGAINIGLRTAADALAGSTAQLPDVDLDAPGSVLGTNTVDAIRAGVLQGFLGGVERTIRLFGQETGTRPTVVATGGLCRFVARHTDLIDVVDPDLIFRGLAVIHARTSRRSSAGRLS